MAGMIKWFTHIVVMVLGVIILTGCQGSEVLFHNYSCLDVSGSGEQQAMLASQTIMRNEFGQVLVNTDKMEVNSRPKMIPSGSASLSTREVRESSHLKIVKLAGKSWLCLRIVTERQDSPAWSAFSPSPARVQDYRYASPMETGESADRSKREIWVVVSRDRERERRIIQRIEETLKQEK